jgi:hypothetical protein
VTGSNAWGIYVGHAPNKISIIIEKIEITIFSNASAPIALVLFLKKALNETSKSTKYKHRGINTKISASRCRNIATV